MRSHELECVVKLFGFLRGRLYEPHAHDHAKHDPSRCRMWFHIGDDTLRRAAVPNAKPDAKPHDKPHDKPYAKPNAEPDVCTDRLHCVGLGAMVGLQPAVRPRIPEAQSRGSHRCAIWRRLPGGERIVPGPKLQRGANLRLHTFAVDGLGNLQ